MADERDEEERLREVALQNAQTSSPRAGVPRTPCVSNRSGFGSARAMRSFCTRDLASEPRRSTTLRHTRLA